MDSSQAQAQEKYKVIFVIGPPGAGKNTQCDKIVETFGVIHFGAGDLLRAEAKKDTEEGALIRDIIKEGKIVPTKITCGLVKKNMDSHGKDKVFLIDGYPRNIENLEGWKEVFGNEFTILCTLYLTCDEQTCVARLMNRGQTSGRSDDEEAVIKKRFNTFYNESMPVVEKLAEIGPLVEIDSRIDPKEAAQNIKNELEKLIK